MQYALGAAAGILIPTMGYFLYSKSQESDESIVSAIDTLRNQLEEVREKKEKFPKARDFYNKHEGRIEENIRLLESGDTDAVDKRIEDYETGKLRGGKRTRRRRNKTKKKTKRKTRKTRRKVKA